MDKTREESHYGETTTHVRSGSVLSTGNKSMKIPQIEAEPSERSRNLNGYRDLEGTSCSDNGLHCMSWEICSSTLPCELEEMESELIFSTQLDANAAPQIALASSISRARSNPWRFTAFPRQPSASSVTALSRGVARDLLFRRVSGTCRGGRRTIVLVRRGGLWRRVGTTRMKPAREGGRCDRTVKSEWPIPRRFWGRRILKSRRREQPDRTVGNGREFFNF
ncbi:hypothetical protein CRG98_006002 [Punica granatum]|uniref:Uncharacterized protein n=1 Tax=Punica granatum TaxID=22663 RepID=A0A2I0KYS6_PUNGR|nr:hypothetical protein CRG98_006002 [Punica granatum]